MIARDRNDPSPSGRCGADIGASRRGFLKRLVGGGIVLAATPFLFASTPFVSSPPPALGDAVAGGGSLGQEVQLFNGRDLTGWESFLVEEGARMEDVWSVENGILVGKGEPRGHLHTAMDYESFRLVVEWRWPEEPGNSGVLMRITGEPAMLPNSVEAQLQSGNAGDMYGFQGFKIGGEEERLSEISIGWRLGKIEGNENEPGQWNRYEITVDGDRITLHVNGMLVNEATGCDIRPGRIGLQSEGGVIHFRTVTLTPLR